MATRKPKPVYTITPYDDNVPAAVYSTLKTLCQQWGVMEHYSTIWKWLRKHDEPYEDNKLKIKKHILILSKYVQKSK